MNNMMVELIRFLFQTTLSFVRREGGEEMDRGKGWIEMRVIWSPQKILISPVKLFLLIYFSKFMIRYVD